MIISVAAFLGGVLISLAFFFVFKRQMTKKLNTRNNALIALQKLDEIMMSSLDLEEVSQKITDAIAFELKFEIGVLALIDDDLGVLRRVAMSQTAAGLKSHKYLPIPYTQISIPMNENRNLLIQALKDGKRKMTHSLYDVFIPVLDEATSNKIQTSIGIKTSLIYPVSAKGQKIGVLIIGLAREEKQISSYEFEMIEKLVDTVGIALDNARLYQELKEASQQVYQMNAQIHRLDKLKDDFVSLASHELRTPMTTIRSYVWMALNRSDIPLSEKLKRYLYRTLISTERLINLVNNMLNVSRIEAGHIDVNPKSMDLMALVKEVMEEMMPKAQESKVKLFVLETKLPQVFADQDKVHEILLNLIGNSMKFTSSGGSITVSFFTDGKVVETIVKDTGQGISKDDLSKLFKKFSRIDNSNSYVAMGTSGGTGLGLYISKSLVELMRGKIWANSEGVGKGTTFTFSLPIATPEILREAEKYKVKAVGEVKGLEPVAI